LRALQGDLSVPDENTTAIRVTAHSIRIDLGGHRIKGPVTCFGSPVVCTVSGSGVGIDSVGIATANRLFVANGDISSGYGLRITAGDSTYGDNVIVQNEDGGVTGTWVNLGGNYCAGTGVGLSTCP
jgi:hypothetical protein